VDFINSLKKSGDKTAWHLAVLPQELSNPGQVPPAKYIEMIEEVI
jgi:hypothetical protein